MSEIEKLLKFLADQRTDWSDLQIRVREPVELLEQDPDRLEDVRGRLNNR